MCTNKFCRGQVWWVENTDNTTGSIEGKTRPYLIVSNDKGNSTSTTCNCVPLSTREYDGFPTHVAVNYTAKKAIVLCEQITTKDFRSFTKYLFTLSDKTMDEVDRCLSLQLHIELASTQKINALFNDLFNKLKALLSENKPLTTEQVVENGVTSITDLVTTTINGSKRSTVFSTPKHKEAKEVKLKYHHWSTKDMIEYLKDYNERPVEYVMKRWGIYNRKTAIINAAKFKKRLEENNEKGL